MEMDVVVQMGLRCHDVCVIHSCQEDHESHQWNQWPWQVQKIGDARIGLVGFPSVGKSSLLTALTGVQFGPYICFTPRRVRENEKES